MLIKLLRKLILFFGIKSPSKLVKNDSENFKKYLDDKKY